MSVFGGQNRDSAGAFRQATHLPNAQIYLTGACDFLELERNMRSVGLEHFLSVRTNAGCKIKSFSHVLVKWSLSVK